MRLPLAALALSFALAACATQSPPRAAAPAGPPLTRTAWIVGPQGGALGQATFTESTNGVLIHLEFGEHGLPPGWHGLHFHQRADCTDAAAGFQASGSHVGMDDRHRLQHGLMNPQGPEAGDLPNIFATPVGIFGAEVFAPHVTLGAQETSDHRKPLLDADGSALIVHAGPDDYHTQPIGGAGPRIGCAALTALP